MLLGFTLLHSYIALGVLGVALLFFVLLAALFAAFWFNQKHNRISELRERADEDVDHFRDLGLTHIAAAIRHALNGKGAKAVAEIHKIHDIWKDPAQRATAEQTVRDKLIEIAAKGSDDQWQAVLKKVAAQDAARNFNKQAQAAVAAFAPPPAPPLAVSFAPAPTAAPAPVAAAPVAITPVTRPQVAPAAA